MNIEVNDTAKRILKVKQIKRKLKNKDLYPSWIELIFDRLNDKNNKLNRKGVRDNIVLLNNSDNILPFNNNKHQILVELKKLNLLVIMQKIKII